MVKDRASGTNLLLVPYVALIITSIMVGLIYTCSIMVVQEVKEVRETLGWIDPEPA